MARQYVKLSSSQPPYSSQPNPLIGPYNLDENRAKLAGQVNDAAVWPISGFSSGGFDYRSDVVKIPDVRAIALAPNTDVDGVMIQFGTDPWRFLGPGAVIYPTNGTVDNFRAQPAFPAAVYSNPLGLPGNVDRSLAGDCIVEVFSGVCPPPGFVPRLMPMRIYPIPATFTFFEGTAAIPQTGYPQQHILAVSGYNVERAQFSFAAATGVCRCAIAEANDPWADGFGTQEDWVESDSADLGNINSMKIAALFNANAPWIIVMGGSDTAGSGGFSGGKLAQNSMLCVTRRFIG